MQARAEEWAASLVGMGVQHGDRVAVMVPNGFDLPIAWLASSMLGALTVPVNPAYGSRDVDHVLSDSGASIVLAGSTELERLTKGSIAAERVVRAKVSDGQLSPPRSTPNAPPRQPTVKGSDAVSIQYTSGTTGLPKGCVLDHRYWLRLGRSMQRYAGLGPDDVLLTAQPQSYMDPTWNLVLALLVGAPLVVLPRFSPSTFWDDVRRTGTTFFYCIGTMPVFLLKQPPNRELDRAHQVRLVLCSGIPPLQHRAIEERWGCPWREVYGSTELGAVLAIPPEDSESIGSGSMGRPVPGREVRVVDDSGTDVEVGSTGELLVRGPDTMIGYYGNAEATSAWKPDGWARTGDLVVESNLGFRLVGRSKDMIRRAGENISAAEVEGTLLEHPTVVSAACIAVPDPLRGEEVKAYVQLVGGADPSPAQLHGFVHQRLAAFKVPRYIEFVKALPLTQSGKTAKAEILRSRTDHISGAWDAQLHMNSTRPDR